MSPAERYAAAVAAHDLAAEQHRAAKGAYRAGRITDHEYLAYRRNWDAACAAFDAEFDLARENGVELLDNAERPSSPHRR